MPSNQNDERCIFISNLGLPVFRIDTGSFPSHRPATMGGDSLRSRSLGNRASAAGKVHWLPIP